MKPRSLCQIKMKGCCMPAFARSSQTKWLPCDGNIYIADFLIDVDIRLLRSLIGISAKHPNWRNRDLPQEYIDHARLGTSESSWESQAVSRIVCCRKNNYGRFCWETFKKEFTIRVTLITSSSSGMACSFSFQMYRNETYFFVWYILMIK